eukprot:1156653-Pelagomonas_calceolata.AAC.6
MHPWKLLKHPSVPRVGNSGFCMEKIKSRLGKRNAQEREGEERDRDPHAPRPLNPGQERVRKRLLSEYGEQQQQQQQQALESGGCAETEEI